MKFVLDASSAFVILSAPERLAPSFSQATDVLAPDLIVAELLNARWKISRSGATAPSLESMLGLFARIRMVATLPYAADAAALARRIDHPVYDCLYAVIAAREGAQLLTADRRFAGKLASEPIDVLTVE